jgi:regulatory protein
MRAPWAPTAERLEKAALAYLERFEASAETLRRVLRRRIERAVRHGLAERAEGLALAEAVVAKMLRLGLVDDCRYAENKAASLRRGGRSARAIRLALAARGIGAEIAAAALARQDEDGERSELAAAIAHARKRRLGPFRDAGERQPARAKDLAAMSRAGFDYEIARRVVLAASVEALEADLAE